MAFLESLERVAGAVERRLDRLLAKYDAPPGGARLGEAMRYAALGGGKRLRPFLLVESARLFGVTDEEALPAATALECVHCYSLVHDDLPSMDDDAVRRGRPTLHIAFDEATAILAGDALLTLAFEILSDESTHSDPAIRAELVLLLAKAAGWRGMALGQALDLSTERQGFGTTEIAAMQALKTGALFRFACEAGAALGHASRSERAALTLLCLSLRPGLPARRRSARRRRRCVRSRQGRRQGCRARQSTLVARVGPDDARKRLGALLHDAEAALAPFGDRAQTLRELARFIATRKA